MSTKKTAKDQFEEKRVLSTLSENLRAILDARGLEPRPFAIEFGIEPMVVYRILRAETTPKVHVVARLASILGVTIDEPVSEKKKK